MTLYLGPLAKPIALRDPAAGVSSPLVTTTERPLLAGGVAVQHRRKTARRWPLVWEWLDPDEVSDLLGLLSGAFGSPPWVLHDPVVAAHNMLPAAAAVPGVLGDWSHVDGQGSPLHATALDLPAGDSRRTATSAGIMATLDLPHDGTAAAPVPIRPGEVYTFSAYAQVSGSLTPSIRWFNASGSLVSTSTGPTLPASTPNVVRAVVTAIAPTAARQAVVRLVPTSLCAVSAAQLTNTPAPVYWSPGRGHGLVTVLDAEATIERISAAPNESISVTLVEVG